jgi:membrane protein DedA with SNARE-associated domain
VRILRLAVGGLAALAAMVLLIRIPAGIARVETRTYAPINVLALVAGVAALTGIAYLMFSGGPRPPAGR